MPRLRLIAGPNGSGKTTLTNHLRDKFDVPFGQYVNPDEIELTLQDSESDPVQRSKLAQKISVGQRRLWLDGGISHSYESVMSHESHLQYIKDANAKGYKTYLYYVCISEPEVNIDRVDERVKLGGHPVPKHKVLSRYHRSLSNLYEMATLCHRAYFFDNSNNLTLFAEVTPKGLLSIQEDEYSKIKPIWFRENVLLKWASKDVRVLS